MASRRGGHMAKCAELVLGVAAEPGTGEMEQGSCAVRAPRITPVDGFATYALQPLDATPEQEHGGGARLDRGVEDDLERLRHAGQCLCAIQCVPEQGSLGC